LLLDAVVRRALTLERVVDLVSASPARAFGLEASKGSVAPGLDADLVIAALDDAWTIRNEDVLSRCGWTPYDGVECRARIHTTFLRGRPVFDDGRVVGKPGEGAMAMAPPKEGERG
jgi:dihydroorotase-like cyclic amidohydrolase